MCARTLSNDAILPVEQLLRCERPHSIAGTGTDIYLNTTTDPFKPPSSIVAFSSGTGFCGKPASIWYARLSAGRAAATNDRMTLICCSRLNFPTRREPSGMRIWMDVVGLLSSGPFQSPGGVLACGAGAPEVLALLSSLLPLPWNAALHSRHGAMNAEARFAPGHARQCSASRSCSMITARA